MILLLWTFLLQKGFHTQYSWWFDDYHNERLVLVKSYSWLRCNLKWLKLPHYWLFILPLDTTWCLHIYLSQHSPLQLVPYFAESDTSVIFGLPCFRLFWGMYTLYLCGNDSQWSSVVTFLHSATQLITKTNTMERYLCFFTSYIHQYLPSLP